LKYDIQKGIHSQECALTCTPDLKASLKFENTTMAIK